MLFRFQPTLHRIAPRCGVASLILLAFAIGAAGQRPGGPPAGPGQSNPGAPQGVGPTLQMGAAASVTIRVFNSSHTPFQQEAFVQLYKQGSGTALTGTLTQGNSQAAFDNLPGDGWYTIEVSAAGYRTQRQDFQYSNSLSYNELDFVMEPDSDDPSTSYTPAVRLPAKVQKRVDKGVAEFRGGNLKDAEREFLAAYAAAPKSGETNYLLGMLYLRTKDARKCDTYFTAAIAIDPDDVPALIGLGHLRYNKGDLNGANEVLQKAVTLDRSQWEAFWLLSEIHLRQHDFEKARKEAAHAVELGKGAANGAEFIEGQALAELGQNANALQTLQTFLKDVPADANAATARELCARLESEISATDAASPTPAAAPTAFADPNPPAAPSAPATSNLRIDSLFAPSPTPVPKLQIIDWEPLGVDEEKLPIAAGVTCPSDKVIDEASKRVTEFIDSVNRIDATEQITHEELTTLGHPVLTQKRKFDYLISISDGGSGQLVVDESRQGRDAESGEFLDHVSMFGLADLPLVFHPTMRDDFQLTCEGLGKWQDRATWLVYFRQRPDRPERLRGYQNQVTSFTAGLKGRAWISADTYQIVRLEANLMKPIPQIGLGSEEDVVEYGPVPFRSKNTVLWLPSSADIYYYYRHRPFHRHHSFSNYSLFSVSASQKISAPAPPPEKNIPH